MIDSKAGDLLAAPLGLKLLELISQLDAAAMTDDDLDALLVRLFLVASRHRSDYESDVARLRSQAETLAPLAPWVARRMPSWWRDLERDEQVWATPSPAPPQAERLEVDLRAMHREASKPRRAFWTSTRRQGLASPWLEWPENQLSGPTYLWRVTVDPGARVAEIHSPRDWASFVERYPASTRGFVFTGLKDRPAGAQRTDPDWSSAAEHWDGVHLSTGGWLTAEDVRYNEGEIATELRGWNMESTAWLRWSFSSCERLPAA